MIPYGRQNIDQDDVDAVINVLKSPFLTQGPMVPAFEEQISLITGAKNTVACNSATSALHIACMALDVGNEDIVWTSPISFVASSNCALYCGASIDFVDIDPLTFNICIKKLEEKLEIASQNSKLPKVLIAVHLGGASCDMESISQLSQKFGFSVIEDASHGIGGKYKGQPIGSCLYSDITVFSFHPVKIITTAEGGCATTRSENLANKMRLFRSHGVTRDEKQMTEKSHGGWYYQQIELGYNYRMTDIQAAMGISQLKRLSEFVNKRNEIADSYKSLLKDLPLTTQLVPNDCYSAYHLYIVQLDLAVVKVPHADVFDALRQGGIGVNLHYIPIHLQPYYRELGFEYGDFPEAESYYQKSISIPMFPSLTTAEIEEVVDVIRGAVQ